MEGAEEHEFIFFAGGGYTLKSILNNLHFVHYTNERMY